MEGYPVDLLHSGIYVSTSNPLPILNHYRPTQMDAFGRLRFSQPLTLFDSFYRFQENNKFNYSSNGTTQVSFNSNEGSITLQIGSNAADYIYRESSRVFAYQPGKSLLIYESFTFSPLTSNLRQRIGYFDSSNGIYFQADGSNLSFVCRSSVSGSNRETMIPKSSWNYDRLDGTDRTRKTLDISRSQILFIDIEWLGVGTVRTGFIIDGMYHLCHLFHHANMPSSATVDTTLPYMTTACLPIRAEIENTSLTTHNSRLRVICSSVISEGGYEPRGRSRSIGWPQLDVPYTLILKNTFYPVLAIRLKANRLGAIVIPTNISLISVAGSVYNWGLFRGATVSGGGAWISVGTDSSIEYKMDGTNAITDGTLLKQGLFLSSGNSSPVISLDSDLFRFQLERNTFTNTATTLVLGVASDGQNNKVIASVDWEELT